MESNLWTPSKKTKKQGKRRDPRDKGGRTRLDDETPVTETDRPDTGNNIRSNRRYCLRYFPTTVITVSKILQGDITTDECMTVSDSVTGKTVFPTSSHQSGQGSSDRLHNTGKHINTKTHSTLGVTVKQQLTEVKMSMIRKRSKFSNQNKTYKGTDRVTVLGLVCKKMVERRTCSVGREGGGSRLT